jgi:hypothetical protein
MILKYNGEDYIKFDDVLHALDVTKRAHRKLLHAEYGYCNHDVDISISASDHIVDTMKLIFEDLKRHVVTIIDED